MARKRRSPLSRISTLDIASELQRRRADLPALLARRQELASELSQIENAIAALGGAGRGDTGKAGRRTAAPKVRAARGRKRSKNDSNLSDSLAKVRRSSVV